MHQGLVGPVKEHTQSFVDNLKDLGAKKIVFLHNDDFAMFKILDDFGIEIPFRPVHIFEYLLAYLKKNQRNITKLDKKIAYQRPCTARYAPDAKPFSLLTFAGLP